MDEKLAHGHLGKSGLEDSSAIKGKNRSVFWFTCVFFLLIADRDMHAHIHIPTKYTLLRMTELWVHVKTSLKYHSMLL